MTDRPRFDAEILDKWLARYEWKWGQHVPRLDRIGRDIRARSPVYLDAKELFGFARWKTSGRAQRHVPTDNKFVKEITSDALACRSETDLINGLLRLPGVRAPVASAVLRFIWPDRFGAVDWRNWYVLSHIRSDLGKTNALFAEQLLKPLSSPKNSAGIGVEQYLDYLEVIRRLAEQNPTRIKREHPLLLTKEVVQDFPNTTPAEIDMAIFAYSRDFAKKV